MKADRQGFLLALRVDRAADPPLRLAPILAASVDPDAQGAAGPTHLDYPFKAWPAGDFGFAGAKETENKGVVRNRHIARSGWTAAQDLPRGDAPGSGQR